MIRLDIAKSSKNNDTPYRTSSITGSVQSRQCGVILLLLVIGLFLVSSSVLLTVLNNNKAIQRGENDTTAALLKAKEALIAFALVSEEHFAGAGPGHLFCPDTNGNGLPNTPCAPNALGRLPQSINTALGDTKFSDFDAGIDQQFWFAIDGPVRSNPPSQLNSSTVSNITVNGIGGIAAILIAPGEALGSKIRPNNISSNYLEGVNTSGPAFVSSKEESSETFNDRILTIEYAEIMAPVTSRVADSVKELLDVYHGANSFYPVVADFATVMAGPGAPAWFATNDWPNQFTYVRLNTDSATLVFNGCVITYTVSINSDTARDTTRC